MAANNNNSNKASTNKASNNKGYKTKTRKANKKTSEWMSGWDWRDASPAPALRPISLNWLESTINNSLTKQYQLNWQSEDYEVVELYQPLSWTGFDAWIKSGASYMVEQIKVASTFADMKCDKIRPEDLKLAQGVMHDGARALVPEMRN